MKKEVMVRKRKGNLEPFDAEKIVRVMIAAGLRPIDATELSEKVAKWAEKRGGQITSIEIRDRVFMELEKVDRYASGLYAWYQNLKDRAYQTELKKGRQI
jgi:transcriptional regulator NrdR family protein